MSTHERPFILGLNRYNGCSQDNMPVGRCVVLGVKIWTTARLLSKLREAAEVRRHVIPEFLPLATVIAGWEAAAHWRCVDEAGDVWGVFSDAAMATAVFSDIAVDESAGDGSNTVRNWWWLSDELPREVFWVLGCEQGETSSSAGSSRRTEET